MMMHHTLALAAGLLMSGSLGWAMDEHRLQQIRHVMKGWHEFSKKNRFWNELYEIVELQDVERLKTLAPAINASGWQWYTVDIEKEDIVEKAVKTGNHDLVAILLTIDTVKYAVAGPRNLLHHARDEKMVKLLLQRPFYAHNLCGGRTPLANASQELRKVFFSSPYFLTENIIMAEEYIVLESVVEEGIFDPNLELGEEKNRPLHIISQNFCYFSPVSSDSKRYAKQLWKLFTQYGANPGLTNAYGDTPRDVFMERGRSVAEWIQLTQNLENAD